MRQADAPASGRIRSAIARDSAAGAGNWLHAAARQQRDLDVPLLFLDQDWTGPTGEKTRSFSLRQLAGCVDRLAGGYHRAGIGPRDPVGVYAGAAVDYLTSYLALTSLGAIPVLVNRNLDPRVLTRFLDQIGVVGLVCDAEVISELDTPAGLRVRLSTEEAVAQADGGSLPERYPYRHDDSDPVLITHSSGTTGFPKAVPMQHGNYFSAIRYRLGLPVPASAQRVLCALPSSHNSAIAQFSYSLLSGLPIRMMSTQSAGAVLEAIGEFRPTMVSGFSTTFAALSEADLHDYDLTSVSLWWNSGDAAHERHIRALQRHGRHQDVRASGRQVLPGSAFTDALGSSEMGHSTCTGPASASCPGRSAGRWSSWTRRSSTPPVTNCRPARWECSASNPPR